MAQRIPVYVLATDPVSRAGIKSQLRSQLSVDLVAEGQLNANAVALVVRDQMDEETTRVISSLKHQAVERVVLIVTRIDNIGLSTALGAGARAILRRNDATPEHMMDAIRAALTGDVAIPPDLLGPLPNQLARSQRPVLNPRRLDFTVLTEREMSVLKLLSEGLDTAEVGHRLFYSDRTVKNIVHGVTTRLKLRNRTQAVAYALRQGWI